jgi:hypothetical protein
MVETIVLFALLAISALLLVGFWRGTRRLSPPVDLKNLTVSRQWLIQHQTEDR